MLLRCKRRSRHWAWRPVGGRVQVRWKQSEAATPFGQIAYFAEFLNLTGLYRRWIESCPLHFASPNGSRIADVTIEVENASKSAIAAEWIIASLT